MDDPVLRLSEKPELVQGKRALIIDDESTIRIALKRFFSRLGWQVDDVANGEVALEILLQSGSAPDQPSYDLVISDIRLPGVNGVELYDRLKVSRPDILARMIFSTGDVVSSEVAEFIERTSCKVLAKPFELSTLLEIARGITDSGSQGSALAS